MNSGAILYDEYSNNQCNYFRINPIVKLWTIFKNSLVYMYLWAEKYQVQRTKNLIVE